MKELINRVHIEMSYLWKTFWAIVWRNAHFWGMRDFLQNGIYFINRNGDFYISTKRAKKQVENYFPLLGCVFIFSKHKVARTYDSGKCVERKHKRMLFQSDELLFFFKKKYYYQITKKRINENLHGLPYYAVTPLFVDKYRLMIEEKAGGVQYYDLIHTEKNLNLILDSYYSVSAKSIDMQIGNSVFSIFQCVQHGDFHNDNIFWDDDSYTMIDLDLIDIRPLFYDLFFYGFRANKGHINAWLDQWKLAEKIKTVLDKRAFPIYDNSLDVYLAAFSSSKISRIKKGISTPDLEWYMGWIRGFDFTDYPVTAFLVNEFLRKLKQYGIQWD